MRKYPMLSIVVFSVLALTCGTVFANTIERVNLDYLGNELTGFHQGDSPGLGSDISSDGRYVVFNSYLSNIVPNDTNGKWDVFIRDLETGEIELVSVDSNGRQFQSDSLFPAVSGDGRYVVFVNKKSVTWRGFNNFNNIYVRDRVAETTERVSVKVGIWGNGGYISPAISDDGKVVAYRAYRNFTSGTKTTIYDRESQSVQSIPFSSVGVPAISGNGRYVATIAQEWSPTSYPIYIFDRETEQIHLASKNYDDTKTEALQTNIDMSFDGRYTVFRADSYRWAPGLKGRRATYVIYDLETDTTSPVFLRGDGTPINHHATATGITISADGKQIVLLGADPALFPEDSGINYYGQSYQLFVIDREAKKVIDLISYGYDGEFANRVCDIKDMTADGQYVLFESRATNLAPNDTNKERDAFLADRGPQNAPPLACAGEDQIVECTADGRASVYLDGTCSSDPDGDALSYLWETAFGAAEGATPTVMLPLGTTEVTLTVTDGNGESSTDTVFITVEDTTAPELTVELDPSVLWPANHKLVDITPHISVSDACYGGDIEVDLLNATTNEPGNAEGDGNTDADIVIEDETLKLRAERSGKSDGRTYNVLFEAADGSGNRAYHSATVLVPHAKKK